VFRSIVVGTDGSDTAAEAVRRAAGLAKAFSSPLHVVSAYGTEATPEALLDTPDLGDWVLGLEVEVRALLAGIAGELAADGVKVRIYAVPGHPVPAILDVVGAADADLVVVGNKGMQGATRTIGSVPNSVAHRAPCDVLIVHTA
jgi:nucleotide-binding universal stress UspA family protein